MSGKRSARNVRASVSWLRSNARSLVSGSVGDDPLSRTRNPRLSGGSAGQPVTPGKLKLGRLGNVKRSLPGGVPK